MRLAVDLTLLAWLLVEVTLMARDLARGKGGTARDRGTRSLLAAGWFTAFVTAIWVSDQFGPGSGWRLGRGHLAVGLTLMWIGLAIRVWAVAVLGSAFRTTVEVDAGQPVVDRGPYRLVRHPSYSGILLIAVGYGVTLGDWLSVVILLVIPLATMLRRIAVEEATMTEVIGQPYVAYKERTKKLVPGLWLEPGHKSQLPPELAAGAGVPAVRVVAAGEPVHDPLARPDRRSGHAPNRAD